MKTRAFTLAEILVTLALLAIIAGVIFPRFINVKNQANQGVAQDQCVTFRSAIQGWLSSYNTIAQASTAWGNSVDMTAATYILVNPFLDNNFKTLADIQVTANAGGTVAYTTAQMRQIKGNVFSAVNGYTAVPGLTTAHMRVCWPNDATGARQSTEPTVLFFTPN